jgi:hypothetical protein
MGSGCSHRWGLRDVTSPFGGLVHCRRCDSLVRVSLDAGVEQSTLRLHVLNYGSHGLGLADLESVLVWLGHQLQLGDLPELATVRPMRHKRKHRAAWSRQAGNIAGWQSVGRRRVSRFPACGCCELGRDNPGYQY